MTQPVVRALPSWASIHVRTSSVYTHTDLHARAPLRWILVYMQLEEVRPGPTQDSRRGLWDASTLAHIASQGISHPLQACLLAIQCIYVDLNAKSDFHVIFAFSILHRG